MDKFLRELKDKKVHIIGVTGAEGSNILRFLVKHHIPKITTHDFLGENSVEKNFKLWHKGIPTPQRERLFEIFLKDLSKTIFYSGKDYLKNITSADFIFVPQSWRLYQEQNKPLWEAKKRKTPFYSLTRLYLELAPAKVVTITGTVGKGSVANILVQILKKSLPAEREVYFAGNETWMLQVADKLPEMKRSDILILEVSHRQLQERITQAPSMVVFTNLYPNHLDEVSWEEYKKLKFSLLLGQKKNDSCILNYDIPELREVGKHIKSKVAFFSQINPFMNTKNIQKIYSQIMNTKSGHYLINLLAGCTAANLLGISIDQIKENLASISSLPARLEYLGSIRGIKFYDDIKSTTPWSTLAAANKLKSAVILICGGRTKGINYQDFCQRLKSLVKYVIVLKSELSRELSKLLPPNLYQVVNNLKEALKVAYTKAKLNDNIIVSPGGGFFYTDFVKNKKSIRKLVEELSKLSPPRYLGVTSLLPKEKE